MSKNDLEEELAGLKSLYKGLSSGSMKILQAGVDLSQREIEILKREIKFVEDILARLRLPDDPLARGVAIMRKATGDKGRPKKGR